jgi:hypothetical protein
VRLRFGDMPSLYWRGKWKFLSISHCRGPAATPQMYKYGIRAIRRTTVTLPLRAVCDENSRAKPAFETGLGSVGQAGSRSRSTPPQKSKPLNDTRVSAWGVETSRKIVSGVVMSLRHTTLDLRLSTGTFNPCAALAEHMAQGSIYGIALHSSQ